MFYDGNATLAPSFIYPGKCFGSYYDPNLGTWKQASYSGYNVWNWVVAPFTNEPYTTSHGAYCLDGPNITSVFSATWPSQCPSTTHILTTFATVNITVALSSLILGNQRVLHILSFKLLGNEHPHPNTRQLMLQKVQLFIPLGLQLLANAIITLLTRASPGYADGFTFIQLFLFLAARPRTTWIFALWGAGVPSRAGVKAPGSDAEIERRGTDLGALRPRERVRDVEYNRHQNRRAGRRTYQEDAAWGGGASSRDGTNVAGYDSKTDQTRTYVRPAGSPESWHRTRAHDRNPDRSSHRGYDDEDKLFFPYIRFARGQLVAEAVLLAMASYSIGSTAHFASQSGFYDLISGASHIRYQTYGPEHESAAKMMYAGALWWIICFPVAFMILLGMLMLVYKLHDAGMGWSMIFFSSVLMCSLWLGNWLFLAGFVNLMGPLYCPPNLTAQAAIWVATSVFGILTGAGFG